MKSGLFYILNFVVVALGRQTIPIKVTIDEVDGRRTQTSSQMTQPLADLRQQLRKLGLHPSDYTFSVFYNANQNDLIRIRLDSSSGQVRPPRFGYDRETVCGKMFVSRPCIDSYVLQAEPKDKSRNENTVLFDLEITINNINDHKPKFQTTKAVKKIREGSTTGHLVSLPKAVDQDSKDAVRTYKLQHTGNSEQYFEIQTKPRRGELLPYLRLVKTLDHETIAKFRMTLVAADAAGQTAKLPLEVEVVDANDNAPVWPPTTKRTITIAECDDRQPRVIAQFDATDRDSGKFGKLAYELSETNSQEIVKHFYIVDKQLRLTKEFDYEDSQLENPIQVEVDAKDGGGLTSSTTFTVNVTDCNDNPPMVKVRYVAKSVTENVQEEKLVARVLVTDRDSGENGRVDCHLDDNSKLHIEDSSEVVRPRAPRIYKLLTKVTAKFDRESQETYQTNLVCRDHGHKRLKGIVFITLKVNDTNDHKPIFESRLYKFHVMENLPPGSLINGLMKANDADTGRNSRLNYSLNAEGEKYFSLDGNTGQLHGVQLRLRQSFDREQQRNYTFQVVARDNGQPSQSATATVRVVIDDENDNEPRFTQNGRYIFNVTEALCDVNSVCSYRHAPIGQVHADDPDLGEFAIVTYKLGSSLDFGRDSNANVRTYFRVESNTGKIYTKSALNREQTATWQFEVVARNRGNSVYSSTATVIVNVLDINDNPPEFVFPNRGNRTVSIDESAVPGTRLVRIEAKDPDAGVNGTVRYKFEKSNHQSPAFDSYFQINKRNGTITLIRKLSKYKHRYINLLIRAEDGAKQPKQSRLANLRVVILRRRGLGPRGPRGGANGHGTYHHDDLLSAEEDGSMQVLLVLAGVVFFVFAALLGILVYMYASGRLGLPCPSCLGGELCRNAPGNATLCLHFLLCFAVALPPPRPPTSSIHIRMHIEIQVGNVSGREFLRRASDFSGQGTRSLTRTNTSFMYNETRVAMSSISNRLRMPICTQWS